MDLQYLASDSFNKTINTVEYLQLPLTLILIILITFGTLGNVLVIAAVYSSKELYTNVGNVFIVNLACADILITSIVDPFSIVGILYGESYFAQRLTLCKLVSTVCLVACFCSLLSIGAISINRYLHICKNQFYVTHISRRNSNVSCVILWLFSFLFQVGTHFGWGDHGYDLKSRICVFDRTADYSYTIFFTASAVGFPLFIIATCYLKIFVFVVRSSSRIVTAISSSGRDNEQNIQESHSKSMTTLQEMEMRRSLQLARTLFVIVMVFAFCWAPYASIIIFDFNDTLPAEYYSLSILLAHGSSSLNCIIYGLTNRQYRKSYIRIIKMFTYRKTNHRQTAESVELDNLVPHLSRREINEK